MQLPMMPPISPMLARNAARLPTDDGWIFEPKWDGFRCLVFRDGDEVELWSRHAKPFNRYFPELADPLRAQLPARAVVDGELVVPSGDGLSFDLLGQRIHPAASRVEMLAETTPARFVAFDVLAVGDEDLRDVPFGDRRARLEALLTDAVPPLHLTPATTDHATATDWFERFEGAGVDGIIAKPIGDPYAEGSRTQRKLKHQRTADVVVAGMRWHKSGQGVGSLLLGLWRGDHLQHIGVASSFTAARRVELVSEVEDLRLDDVSEHPWAAWSDEAAHEAQRLPGAPSRWSGQRDAGWVPLRIARVAEVGFNQLTDGRLRHPAKFVRWRPDKPPHDCTYDQLEVAPPAELDQVFGAGS
ncbi:MAG: ATP-dependent DNA ligase [Actinobacteria bacterium]|nr:ATP-dependent DNA ligase [Actinomycetota bacterium]